MENRIYRCRCCGRRFDQEECPECGRISEDIDQTREDEEEMDDLFGRDEDYGEDME